MCWRKALSMRFYILFDSWACCFVNYMSCFGPGGRAEDLTFYWRIIINPYPFVSGHLEGLRHDAPFCLFPWLSFFVIHFARAILPWNLSAAGSSECRWAIPFSEWCRTFWHVLLLHIETKAGTSGASTSLWIFCPFAAKASPWGPESFVQQLRCRRCVCGMYSKQIGDEMQDLGVLFFFENHS